MGLNKINNRISNVPRSELATLWLRMPPNEFNDIIQNSNGREIARVFSALTRNQLNSFFTDTTAGVVNHVFGVLDPRLLGKYLFMVSKEVLRKIMNLLEPHVVSRVFEAVSPSQRNSLLSIFPVKKKIEWKSYIEDKIDVNNERDYMLKGDFENSIDFDALERLKQVENQIALKEQQHSVRMERENEQLEVVQRKIAESEKYLFTQNEASERKINNIRKREEELSNKVRDLQEEHDRRIQEKIDLKVPEFVSEAISGLEEKVTNLKTESEDWNKKGLVSLRLTVGGALSAIVYGAWVFHEASQTNIDWMFFAYLMLKGLVVISVLGAYAKHCFNQSNACVHESLKRSDRIHAIRFGKLYLEIYGNNVEKQDMKHIFENWNLESDSAFTKIKTPDFDAKLLEKLKGVMSLNKG